MNQQSDTAPPTLFHILAREWMTGAAICSMRFNAQQTAVAYALDNGNVAIADVHDDDAPELRIHIDGEHGRATIRPRTKTPKPLILAKVDDDDGHVLLCAMGKLDYVACCASGSVFRISPSGVTSSIDLNIPGPVTAMDYCLGNGQFTVVSGTQVTIFSDGSDGVIAAISHFDPGESVAGLVFSSDGEYIAVTHGKGLTIWSSGANPQKIKDVAFSGQPGVAHWSPDDQWIATPLAEGGFQLSRVADGHTRAVTGYPMPVKSVAWNSQANAVVTSGGFRVTAWSMDTPPLKDNSSGAIETGRAGLVPVSAVSSHPDRNLVIAGYENGYASIMQMAERDELVLNNENHGAIIAVAWSRDGKRIALGTDQGLAAIVSIPPQMFK